MVSYGSNDMAFNFDSFEKLANQSNHLSLTKILYLGFLTAYAIKLSISHKSTCALLSTISSYVHT